MLCEDFIEPPSFDCCPLLYFDDLPLVGGELLVGLVPFTDACLQLRHRAALRGNRGLKLAFVLLQGGDLRQQPLIVTLGEEQASGDGHQ